MSEICAKFFTELLREKAPEDVWNRLQQNWIGDPLKERLDAAFKEIELIVGDFRKYPIDHDDYYTDLVKKSEQEKITQVFRECISDATSEEHISCLKCHHAPRDIIDVEQVVSSFSNWINSGVEDSCEKILIELIAIYEVRNVLSSDSSIGLTFPRYLGNTSSRTLRHRSSSAISLMGLSRFLPRMPLPISPTKRSKPWCPNRRQPNDGVHSSRTGLPESKADRRFCGR